MWRQKTQLEGPRFDKQVDEEEIDLLWKEEMKRIDQMLEGDWKEDHEELNGAAKNEDKEVGAAKRNEAMLENFEFKLFEMMKTIEDIEEEKGRYIEAFHFHEDVADLFVEEEHNLLEEESRSIEELFSLSEHLKEMNGAAKSEEVTSNFSKLYEEEIDGDLFVAEMDKELQNDGMKINEDAYLCATCLCEEVVEDATVGRLGTTVEDMKMMRVDENLIAKDEMKVVADESDDGNTTAVKKEVNLFVFCDDIVLHSFVMLRVEEYEEKQMEIVDFHEVVGADLYLYATGCDVYDEGNWWRWSDYSGSEPMEEEKSSEFVWWMWLVDDGGLDPTKEDSNGENHWRRRTVHGGCKSIRGRRKRV